VNKKKPKHLFGRKELVQFTNTFWTVDDNHFTHPRNKVQIPFIIAVFCWTGARIGAFFPLIVAAYILCTRLSKNHRLLTKPNVF